MVVRSCSGHGEWMEVLVEAVSGGSLGKEGVGELAGLLGRLLRRSPVAGNVTTLSRRPR